MHKPFAAMSGSRYWRRNMIRAAVCGLALFAGASAVRAGELDREPVPAAKASVVASSLGGSELDRESPQTAHGWRWGNPYFYGPGPGWVGYYPARWSYLSFGFGASFYPYRPFGFYNGFLGDYYGGSGFLFPAYFPTYYPSFGYPCGW
jgi:hypothetical protein